MKTTNAPTCTRPSKAARRVADELNGVIHRRNLYHATGRYYNAVPGDGCVMVENLHTGAFIPYTEPGFTDGYGRPVTLCVSSPVIGKPEVKGGAK